MEFTGKFLRQEQGLPIASSGGTSRTVEEA